MKKKLRNQRGASLTEMLCTVLIVLLISALLVVGVRFAVNTYGSSVRLSEAQELCSTLTTVISDKLRFCGTVRQSTDGGISRIFIQNVGDVEGDGDTFQINEDGQVVLGTQKLLGSKAYPRGLRVRQIRLDFNSGTNIFSVALQITDSSGKALSETAFEVKRLNSTAS